VKKAYDNRPVEFIATAAGILGTIGGVLVWAARNRNPGD